MAFRELVGVYKLGPTSTHISKDGTLVVDTLTNKLYVHDGVTAGGIPVIGLGSTTSVVTAVTALGTSQNTAVLISNSLTIVTTVASGTGMRLPASPLDVVFTVINRGTSALLVYPPSNASIESNAVNAPVSIAIGGIANFVLTSATQVYAY